DAGLLDGHAAEPGILRDERVVARQPARDETGGVLRDRGGDVVVALVEDRAVVVAGLAHRGDRAVAVLVELVVRAGALEHRRDVAGAVLVDRREGVVGPLAQVRGVGRAELGHRAGGVRIAFLVRFGRRRAALVEVGVVGVAGLAD